MLINVQTQRSGDALIYHLLYGHYTSDVFRMRKKDTKMITISNFFSQSYLLQK